MPFGVYLHFPYCLSKCPYCDFASEVVETIPQRRYARAVARELELRREAWRGRPVTSIYFGGGTPSLLEPARLEELLALLPTPEPGAELTLEANPGASDFARFEAFHRAGLNRLSIGIQSFDAKVLNRLGRRHTGDEATRAVEAARAAGFDNLSLDLIYGSPGQTLALARNDAERAVALRPEHLSVYALTLDVLAVPVPMAQWVESGRMAVPEEDDVCAMATSVRDVLERSGLARYEISNHARPGFEARHNTLYWTGGEYLGLGPGASGFALHDPSDPSRGGRRWSNVRSPSLYYEALDRGALPEESTEELSAGDLLRERLLMGLRLVRGVDLETACRELRTPPEPILEKARPLARRGLATLDGLQVRLTERGLDFHSEAALAFV